MQPFFQRTELNELRCAFTFYLYPIQIAQIASLILVDRIKQIGNKEKVREKVGRMTKLKESSVSMMSEGSRQRVANIVANTGVSASAEINSQAIALSRFLHLRK